MPSLQQRMRRMTTILAIRLGSGAAIVPRNVTRIHMRFAQKLNGGHMGSRKFWKHELIRLKYHNPALPMTVDRTASSTDPATMTIFFAPDDAVQTSGSTTSAPAPTSSTSGDKAPSDYTPADRTEEIDMTNRVPEEILTDLLRITRATPVLPTAEEQEELQQLEQQRLRSEKDSKLSLSVQDKRKREEEILAQARGEVAADAA